MASAQPMSGRVTFKGGKSKVTDGPFTEAKEVVGGFWIIQVKSREEALARQRATTRAGVLLALDGLTPLATNGTLASPPRETKWSKPDGCSR